jgi:hypothetical protein
VFLVLTLTIATANSQTLPNEPQTEAPVSRRIQRQNKKLNERHIDFEDPTDVFGSITAPMLEVIFDRPIPEHPPLFALRLDFDEELDQSVQLVK